MKQQSLHGVIIIDKPTDVTSHAVVGKVKKILNVRKSGHAGTLDPFATGVLAVCLNEGTKLAHFLMEQDKEYEGTILLGVETDTQDSTGNVVKQREPEGVDAGVAEAVLKSFEGVISQIPPMYSAIKRNGVPLYKLARKGIEVERKARTVTVHSLDLLSLETPRLFFRVSCSKGTYIRTLAGDIGSRLGCGGSLEALKRTRSGRFCIEKAIRLDSLPELSKDDIMGIIVSPAQALDFLPAIVVNERVAVKIRHGAPVFIDELECEIPAVLLKPLKQVTVLNPEGQLLAVAETIDGFEKSAKDVQKVPAWKLLRVFNRF